MTEYIEQFIVEVANHFLDAVLGRNRCSSVPCIQSKRVPRYVCTAWLVYRHPSIHSLRDEEVHAVCAWRKRNDTRTFFDIRVKLEMWRHRMNFGRVFTSALFQLLCHNSSPPLGHSQSINQSISPKVPKQAKRSNTNNNNLPYTIRLFSLSKSERHFSSFFLWQPASPPLPHTIQSKAS